MNGRGVTGSLARLRRRTLIEILLSAEPGPQFLEAARQAEDKINSLTGQIEARLESDPSLRLTGEPTETNPTNQSDQTESETK